MSIKSIRLFCEYKASAFLRQVDDIARSEFPHNESSEALKKVRAVVDGLLQKLRSIPDDYSSTIQREYCVEVSRQIALLHQHLGFILRSTNIRNSFEFFDPLNRLCKQLLGSKAQLILSSEWEWSPMTLPMNIPQLPEFVLIGLPAFESENALLIPLAGHEIGHSVWLKEHLQSAVLPALGKAAEEQFRSKWDKYISLPDPFGLRPKDQKDFMNNIFSHAELRQTLSLSVSQCTEVFCDFVGLRIFGESFLRAFEYFLAPEQNKRFGHSYPSEKQRVTYMVNAAEKLGVSLSHEHANYFLEDGAVGDQVVAFLGEIADRVTASVVDTLADKAKLIIENAKVPSLDSSKVEALAASLRRGVPTDGPHPLQSIIGAAWLTHDDSSWRATTDPNERLQQLSEVVFKSIEVSEYCTKLDVNAA